LDSRPVHTEDLKKVTCFLSNIVFGIEFVQGKASCVVLLLPDATSAAFTAKVAE